jgi:hypothetical protein
LSICFIFFFFISKLVQVTLKFTERSDEDEDGGYDLSRESQFVNKWGGYTEIIWLLAGGDITKIRKYIN